MLINPTIASLIVGIVALVVSLFSVLARYRSKYKEFSEVGIFLKSKWLRENPETENTNGKENESEKTNNRSKIGMLLGERIQGWKDEYVHFDSREMRLREAVLSDQNVVVTSESGVGKTRTALEVIRDLSRNEKKFNNILLIFLHEHCEVKNLKIYKQFFIKKYPFIFLFYDDIDKYVENKQIFALISKVKKVSKRVMRLCTCRIERWEDELEDHKESILYHFEEEILIPRLEPEEGKEIARKTKKPFPSAFYGGADEILLEKFKKVREYKKLEDEQKIILKTLKLLNFAYIRSPKIELVKKVSQLKFEFRGDWSSAYKELNAKRFLFEDEALERIIVPDAFLLHVVSDYLTLKEIEKSRKVCIKRLISLYEILLELEAWEEILSLVHSFISYGCTDEALSCLPRKEEIPAKLHNFHFRLYNSLHKTKFIVDFEKIKEKIGKIIIEKESEKYRFSKRIIYNTFAEKKKSIMYAIKLCRSAFIFRPKIELVQKISQEIFNIQIDWLKHYTDLKNENFFSEEDGCVILSEEDSDEIINDYPVSEKQINKHYLELKNILISEKDADGLKQLASKFVELDKNYNALDCFSAALGINSRIIECYMLKGDILFEFSSYSEALENYNRALRINNRIFYVYYQRARIYSILGNFNKAAKDFSRTLELNPNDLDARYHRAQSFYYLGKIEEAKEDTKIVLDIEPTFHQAYKLLGDIYFDSGKFEKAVNSYNQAISIDSKSIDTIYMRGNSYQELREYGKAIEDYNAIIKINPEYAKAFFDRGRVYENLEKPKKAIADFTKAIEIDSSHYNAYIHRGIIYRELDKDEEALDDFDEAIKINPGSISSRYQKGLTYYDLRVYKIAIEYFKTIIEKDPENSDAHCLLADIYTAQDNYREALKHYNKAVDLEKDEKELYYKRGRIFTTLNKPRQALKDFNTALKLDSKHIYSYIERGYQFYLMEKFDRAIADYNHALQLDPNNALVYANRSEIYHLQNKKRLAIADIEKAIEIDYKMIYENLKRDFIKNKYISPGLAAIFISYLDNVSDNFSEEELEELEFVKEML